MEVYIKYNNTYGFESNYTRFGRIIPKSEQKIDLEKFFGKKDVDFVYKQLKADKNISIKPIQSEALKAKCKKLDEEVENTKDIGREALSEKVRSQKKDRGI